MTEKTKLIISTERGYPTCYNGKRHYGITFETIDIRSFIEPELGKMKTGLTYSLPDGYYFKITKGLDKVVAKVCKTDSINTDKTEFYCKHVAVDGEYACKSQCINCKDKTISELNEKIKEQEATISLLESNDSLPYRAMACRIKELESQLKDKEQRPHTDMMDHGAYPWNKSKQK